MRKMAILTIVLLPFLFVFTSKGQNDGALHYLNLRRVVTDSKVKSESDYQYGKSMYPRYKLHGLPENFMLKKSPDLSFGSQDLKAIRIARQPFSQVESYIVTIVFEASVIDKVVEYTKHSLGNQIAVSVDDYILVIATILDPIGNDGGNEFSFTVTNRKLDEIENKLKLISQKIVVE